MKKELLPIIKTESKVKQSFILALFLALVFVLAGCGPGGKRFTLYTWSEMFPEEILAGFERESGYRINYINFDLDETMLTKLKAQGGGGYDLIIADDYIIELAIAEGLAQKLDKSKIPGFGNINPLAQGFFYDPADEYTVPYGAGVQSIVYDPARVKINISGYADLWNPVLKNSIGVTANNRVITGIPLKVLGKSYNTNSVADIRAAGELLLSWAPNIRIIKDDDLENDLLSGEISVAVVYTPQAITATQENPALRVVYPKEGIGYGLMAAFIPSRAPNSDAAHAFLSYILDPERGAACFEYLLYSSTFSASDPYISEEYRELLILRPEFSASGETIRNIEEAAEEEHARVWTAFREAAGK
jgi:spermidine/putrescine-binding protein